MATEGQYWRKDTVKKLDNYNRRLIQLKDGIYHLAVEQEKIERRLYLFSAIGMLLLITLTLIIIFS